MEDSAGLGLAILVIGLVGTAAVLSNRLSARLRVPAPAFFLVCAVACAELWPHIAALSIGTVQRVVTVALAVILFDGGMHIGRRKFREAAGAIVWTGVAGTVVTAAGTTLAARYVTGLDWRLSLLLGTAVSATDPAVVFSVFGRREIAGRTGVLLEGESGANDPVGIALLAALLGAQGSLGNITMHVIVEFAEQMVIGAAIGVAGGLALLAFMRRVPLPSEGLYAPRVLASVLCVYGAAAFAHGSGFLAVLITGILIGDEPAPYKREIQRFHSSLASLAEITAFIMLGLTIRLTTLSVTSEWTDGLVLAALLAFVIRPVLVGLVTLPIRLSARERVFFLWTGLKGAVPVLLGMAIATSSVPGASKAYAIIFVIVGFSVLVQGGLVPALARWLRIPLRTVDPEPWSLGVRFATEPEGLHRYQVTAGSLADGTPIGDLPGEALSADDSLSVSEGVWVSLVIRDGALITDPAVALRPDDEILVLSDPEDESVLARLFTTPASSSPPAPPSPGTSDLPAPEAPSE